MSKFASLFRRSFFEMILMRYNASLAQLARARDL